MLMWLTFNSLFTDGFDSEISLIHPDDKHCFAAIDETQHRFSTEGDKGGSRKRRRINPTFQQTGDRVTSNARHTTGVYCTSLALEVFPPLYVLDTHSKIPTNYAILPEVCEGLPIVQGYFGGKELKSYPSCVAVRPKGGVDTSCWHLIVQEMIMPCWGDRLHPVPIRDPITKKLIKGPHFLKTDSGPRRPP